MPAWKSWEQTLVGSFQEAAGRVKDSVIDLVVTSLGRAGHIYDLQADGFVGEHPGTSLVIEAKRVKMPVGLRRWLELLMLHAYEYRRFPILGWNLDSDYGRKQKIDVSVKKANGEIVTTKVPIIDKWCFIPFDYLLVLMETARKHPELVNAYWQKVKGKK